jgi:hypothetical protein
MRTRERRRNFLFPHGWQREVKERVEELERTGRVRRAPVESPFGRVNLRRKGETR